MHLQRIHDTLCLHFGHGLTVAFREEWAAQLRGLPLDQYGIFLRDTVYPALSKADRRTWHRVTIDNRSLHKAIQELPP